VIDLRRAVRIARLAARDAWDVVTNTRPPMTPSRVQAFKVGVGEFHAVGEHLARLLIDAGGLQPHERVLDVGCGIGRAAVPLTRYLTTGSYAGFDISRDAIEWCRRNITPAFPRFTFATADIYNSHYNRYGRVRPEEFSFPEPDASCDVVFLSSILTHLAPSAAARYVAETARVLKSGGRAIMTWFLIDDSARERMHRGAADKYFTPSADGWWYTENAKDPEAAIAYERGVVEHALRDRGLEITRVSLGRWSVHDDALTYQDIIVATK
jgi:SAM-dependent methyltransferase